MTRRGKAGLLVGLLASVAGAVALLLPAVQPASGARHTLMHVNCKHHSHGTTKARDAQVAKFAARRQAKRVAAGDADIAARALTAGRPRAGGGP